MSDNAPPSVPAAMVPQIRSFWAWVEKTIDERLQKWVSPTRPRIFVLEVPFGNPQQALATGYILTLGIEGICRIVGYSIAMTNPLPGPAGSVTLDVRYSNPTTHPTTPSIVSPFPALSGYYTEVAGIPSNWIQTQFTDGDMLHFYVLSASGINCGLLRLRMRDLSVPTD